MRLASLRPLSRLAAALVAAVALAACSGPAALPDTPTEPAGPTYPAWETFDPAADTADPPARVEVVHDVPAAVMEGTVRVPGSAPQPNTETDRPEPVPTQVEGYRVQVFSSTDRQAAERVRGEAMDWWRGAQSAADAPAALEAVVAYIQPYYRVRLGAFEFDGEAADAVTFVRRRFSDAFVVPDLVTVMK